MRCIYIFMTVIKNPDTEASRVRCAHSKMCSAIAVWRAMEINCSEVEAKGRLAELPALDGSGWVPQAVRVTARPIAAALYSIQPIQYTAVYRPSGRAQHIVGWPGLSLTMTSVAYDFYRASVRPKKLTVAQQDEFTAQL